MSKKSRPWTRAQRRAIRQRTERFKLVRIPGLAGEVLPSVASSFALRTVPYRFGAAFVRNTRTVMALSRGNIVRLSSVSIGETHGIWIRTMPAWTVGPSLYDDESDGRYWR